MFQQELFLCWKKNSYERTTKTSWFTRQRWFVLYLFVWRILVVSALPFSQRVFITDPSHQVAEAGDPGSGFFCVWRHQVQGLHVVPMVHSETAGWVEAAVRMPMEDVWLTALCHFVQRIDGDWQLRRGRVEKKGSDCLLVEMLDIKHSNQLLPTNYNLNT